MNELKLAYDYIIGGLKCFFDLHDWHYFKLYNESGTLYGYSRYCTRCTTENKISFDEYAQGIEDAKTSNPQL